MAELQERLREEADTWDEPRSNDETDMRGMLHKAADELDRLTAENARLRAKLELTPENVERVARGIAPDAWADELPIPTRAHTIAFYESRAKSISDATAAIKALGADQ